MIVIQRGVSVPLTWKHGNKSAVLIAGTVNKCPTDIKSFMESWRQEIFPTGAADPSMAESWHRKPDPLFELCLDKKGQQILDIFGIDLQYKMPWHKFSSVHGIMPPDQPIPEPDGPAAVSEMVSYNVYWKKE